MTLKPTILIDTREQYPWRFTNLRSEIATLATGDYSIRGLESLVAVERKSLVDLLSCVGHGRDRFKRELQRLRAYRFRALIVESDLATTERGGWAGKVHPNSVIGSLAGWQAQFDLPVVFAGDHDRAARYAEKLLYQFARTVALECEAVRSMMLPETKTKPETVGA